MFAGLHGILLFIIVTLLYIQSTEEKPIRAPTEYEVKDCWRKCAGKFNLCQTVINSENIKNMNDVFVCQMAERNCRVYCKLPKVKKANKSKKVTQT